MPDWTINLDPPPGFNGLDPYKPIHIYERHLPHWRQDGATYFVTFRQVDSLPNEKLQELRFIRTQWERNNRPPRSEKAIEQLTYETMLRTEKWLDQGMGSCRLKDPEAAQAVIKAMHHFDNNRYELDCYVVMPNHVHVVLRPLMPETYPLERILQSWKGYTSRRISAYFQLEGAFWQDESFDRIIRDEMHLYQTIQYIGDNPRRAGLANDECPRWIRPEWERIGWKFEDR